MNKKTNVENRNKSFIIFLILILGCAFCLDISIQKQHLVVDYCRLAESQRRLINKQFDLIETIGWVENHNLIFSRLDNQLICPERIYGISKVKIINITDPIIKINDILKC